MSPTRASTTQHGEAQFLSLLNTHRGILFKVTRVYAANPQDRLELEQEIAAQLWRAFPRYDPSRRFGTWMYRIALNVAISRVRQGGRRADRVVAGAALLIEAEASTAPSPETAASIQRLYRAIGALGEVDRGLILLQLDGYTNTEIAEITGMKASNIGTRLARIRVRLRTHFSLGEQNHER